MTAGPRDQRVTLWVVLPAVVATIMAVIVIGDRFWKPDPNDDGRITAYQVRELTGAVKDLAGKFDAMPKQSDLNALATRLDKDAADEQKHWDQFSLTFGQIGDRFNKDELAVDRIENRVGTLEHPPHRDPTK